jgi:hypothetical protein
LNDRCSTDRVTACWFTFPGPPTAKRARQALK